MSAKHSTENYNSYKSKINYSSYGSYKSDEKNNSTDSGSSFRTIAVILAVLIVAAAGVFLLSVFGSLQVEKSMTLPEAVNPTVEPVQPTPEPTVSPEEIKAREEEERRKAEALKMEASKYSFYQKLEKGYDTNILVLGDVSAMDTEGDEEKGIVDGPKFSGLTKYLEGKYNSDVTVTNLGAIGGNLLADAMRIINMPEEPSYDFVILSYGINENKLDIVTDYEALLLALKNKYPDCSILCTLEPCFHAITSELESMEIVSNSYGIPVINLFSKFFDCGVEKYFDFFESNQTLLSDLGTAEWIKNICSVIDKNVIESVGKMEAVPLIAAKAGEVAKLKLISVSDTRFSRRDETTYTLAVRANGLAYIQHRDMLGENDVKVIADDILYTLLKPVGSETASGSFIIPIHDQLQCEESFEIIFATKELADGFEGVYLIEN